MYVIGDDIHASGGSLIGAMENMMRDARMISDLSDLESTPISPAKSTYPKATKEQKSASLSTTAALLTLNFANARTMLIAVTTSKSASMSTEYNITHMITHRTKIYYSECTLIDFYIFFTKYISIV